MEGYLPTMPQWFGCSVHTQTSDLPLAHGAPSWQGSDMVYTELGFMLCWYVLK
jgi:hypothetical protein